MITVRLNRVSVGAARKVLIVVRFEIERAVPCPTEIAEDVRVHDRMVASFTISRNVDFEQKLCIDFPIRIANHGDSIETFFT